MIQPFIEHFLSAEPRIKLELKNKRPDDYEALFKRLVELLSELDRGPDSERITVIDHGDYQGTRLFIVAEQGYQPSKYWSTFVDYGSCSGCDSFEANSGYGDVIEDEEVDGNWTMMLHMVQGMKEMES